MITEGNWDEDGYLIIRGAVSVDQLRSWTEATDRLYKRFVDGELPNLSQDKETATVYPPHWEWIDEDWKRDRVAFRRWRIVEDDPVFLETIDHPGWFPIVQRLFGHSLQVSLTHVIVYPPDAHDPPYLHVDGGDALGKIRTDGNGPPLYVKAMIFLTDIQQENQGNFSVVPGSHRVPYDDDTAKEIIENGSAQQICVNAGDCVLFQHSLWHGPAPNVTAFPRKTLFAAYTPTFVRPYDYGAIDADALANATPRQRRLLGDFGGWEWRAGCHYYCGPDQAEIVCGDG